MSKVAFAGSYRLSYSGGQVESVFYGPGGGTMTYPYGWTERGYGGTGGIDGSIFQHGGTVTCSGAIIVDFVWDNGGNPNDLPPQTIILAEHGSAYYGAYGSGSCQNGLGHPPVANEWGAVSEGTRYTIRNNPGQQFQLTCTPAANIQVNAGGAGYAQVAYSVTVTPVVLNVRGALQANGELNVLIGQALDLSLSAGSYTLANYNWMVGGSWFYTDEWGPDGIGPKGLYYEYRYLWGPPADAWQRPVFRCVYDSISVLEDSEETSVEGSADVIAGGQTIGRVSLSKDLRVWVPYYGIAPDTSGSHSQYLPAGLFPDRVQAVRDEQGMAAGIEFWGAVGTPALFRGQGVGEWAFAQLCSLDRFVDYEYLGSPHRQIIRSVRTLDNCWPYNPEGIPVEPPGGTWPANSIDFQRPRLADDSPSQGFRPLSFAYQVNDHYIMFIAYRPPGNGVRTHWVPLHRYEWYWEASGLRVPPVGPWSGPGGGVFLGEDIRLPTWRLQWDEVFLNTG